MKNKVIKLLLILFILLILCSCSNIKKSNLYGIDTYIFDDYNFPQVFGKPTLNDDELNNYVDLDIETISTSVSSYIDLLRINELRDYSNKFNYYDIYKWANKYFNEVGFINTKILNEYNKLICSKIIYVIINNNFFILDINRDTVNKEWLKYYKIENAFIDSADDLKNFIYNYGPIKYYELEVIDPKDIIVLDNNDLSYKFINRNTTCYSYYTYNLPMALGKPKLTEKEIQELVKSNDYRLIENSINNIGDAVAYLDALNIRVQGDNESVAFNGGFAVDYGNVFYNNENGVVHSCSGPEIIKLRTAQCSAMATLMNFLLFDDYEEFGYITGRGHAFNYAKGYDEKYYIIDGSDIIGTHRWLLGYVNDISFNSLEELINKHLDAKISPYDFYSDFMISWVYDGIWTFNDDYSGVYYDKHTERNISFPIGVENVNIWLSNNFDIKVTYYTPINPTDHYNFVFAN